MQEINVNYAAYTHVNVKPLQQESHKTLYFIIFYHAEAPIQYFFTKFNFF